MPEYRVVVNFDHLDPDYYGERRVHLAEFNGAGVSRKSLCGAVAVSESDYAGWVALDDTHGPEGCEGVCRYGCEHDRCLNCWIAWESAVRADREAAGKYVPPTRTYTRAKRSKRSKRQATAKASISSERAHKAAKAAASPTSRELMRMWRADLLELGTPEALAELMRREMKRKEKRAKREAENPF